MSIEIHEESLVPWVNASGLDCDRVAPVANKVSRELASWVQSTQRASQPSIFNRAAYVAPDSPYAVMQTAKSAVDNDDIVGGVCEVTEGLMLQGIKWESGDPDDTDIFNQINTDLNLDQFARQWHQEEFRYNQVVIGLWWGRKTYTVRGNSTNVQEPPADPTTGQKPRRKRGPKRKKKYEVVVPVALTYLDPQRVVPLQPGPFGQDKLAWQATEAEYNAWSSDGGFEDAVMAAFTTGPVVVGQDEASYLQKIGVNPRRLIGLNPYSVVRFCTNKMPYERFPTPRLKSVFPLLDMKQQLMESDRVSLVGNANFIILVKQGTKEDPAMPEELSNLQENFKTVAKLPVIIGDHRLAIEIITPNQDHTLEADRYNVLDQRIMARVLGALSVTSHSRDNTLTLARGIARMLENRRHMMKRFLEREIAHAIVEHPGNEGKFQEEPNLAFTPRNVQLDADAEFIKAVMALRDSGDLSRESILEYFGFDQFVEALRRELEAETGMDDIFQTQVPYSTPKGGAEAGNRGPNGAPEPPGVSGARGGRPRGGGDSPRSTQGQIKSKGRK